MNSAMQLIHHSRGPFVDNARPRVLLADDDRELRGLLAAALRKDCYDVTEARDGRELLQCLATDRLRGNDSPAFDLVISDIRMPGRSGIEVLAGLRMTDWATPFILTTAFGTEETHEEARRLGAVAVFDKPFDVDDLRTILCNLFP